MTGRKLSDVEIWQVAGMVIGGMPYRQTAERFNVSPSVIVRLKQHVNQTGNVKQHQRIWQPLKTTPREDFVIRRSQERSRLSSLGLMHILTEILKWTCTKQWRCSYLLRHEGQILNNFKKFLSIKVIKIVLDSMSYETLKWPQIAQFCISSKKNPRPPAPLK
jgi:transposase